MNLEIQLLISGISCAFLRTGPQGQVEANGGILRLDIYHSLTEHERTAVSQAIKAQEQVEGTLRVSRLVKTRYGYHRDLDEEPLLVPVMCRIL